MKDNKIKVKVTCFWEDSHSFLKMIRRFAFGQSHWKNIEFVAGDHYDKLIILTRPYDGFTYDAGKAITILTEPPDSGNIIHHKTSSILPVYLTLPFWQHISEKDLHKISGTGIPKRNLLSAVTSELNAMAGHRKRLELICFLDKVIEEGFSLWGKRGSIQLFPQLRAYRGEVRDKYRGLWSYKYHFACENSFINDYFTEKIFDPIIAECLCFYDGCKNLESFIDERAFIRINVEEPENAVEVIIRSMVDKERAKRIKAIRQQKERLLYHLNPLNIIWMAINGQDVYKECQL